MKLPKSIHHYTEEFLLNALLKALQAQGVKVKEIEPWQEDTDASINLAGEFDGIHIQVGNGYYAVGALRGDSYFKTDGKGKLPGEIKEAKDFLDGKPIK